MNLLRFLLLLALPFLGRTQDIVFRFIAVPNGNAGEQHYTVRPVKGREGNEKILFMLGGTGGKARNYLRFCDEAAKMGYHVISLSYPNKESARKFCQLSEDTACYGQFRQEVVFGIDAIQEYEVLPETCILNRIKEALQVLISKDPEGNWTVFRNEGEVNWRKVVLAGHSQGAGHAAYIAKHYALAKVLMFAGPNDYHTKLQRAGGWLEAKSATPIGRYFAFLHQYDALIPFEEQITQLKSMGIQSPPYTYIPNQDIPSGTQILLSTLDKASPYTHISLVIDSHTPVDENGNPFYRTVWRWMLE